MTPMPIIECSACRDRPALISRLRPGVDMGTRRITRAGTPATIAYGGTSFVTTAPAPTSAPSPIVTPARIVALLPIEAPRLDARVRRPCQSASVCSCRRRDRARIEIVGEHHAVADEDAVLDRHALADERVARDLAVAADRRAALDFDERADPRAVADRAAVQVDELRLWNDDVLPKSERCRQSSNGDLPVCGGRRPAAGAASRPAAELVRRGRSAARIDPGLVTPVMIQAHQAEVPPLGRHREGIRALVEVVEADAAARADAAWPVDTDRKRVAAGRELQRRRSRDRRARRRTARRVRGRPSAC